MKILICQGNHIATKKHATCCVNPRSLIGFIQGDVWILSLVNAPTVVVVLVNGPHCQRLSSSSLLLYFIQTDSAIICKQRWKM
ncbi:hypothetical protein DITRI_Ditri03aG0131000 [Diplodiscus trichospermus]